MWNCQSWSPDFWGERMYIFWHILFLGLLILKGSVGKKRYNNHTAGWHTIFSHIYLLVRCNLIEVLKIMAQMLQYIIFLSLKPIKVSSDFILNYLKKSCRGHHHSEISKTNKKTWYLHYGPAPRGARGVKNTGRTKGSITWCVFALIFSPNWINFQKLSKNSHFW